MVPLKSDPPVSQDRARIVFGLLDDKRDDPAMISFDNLCTRAFDEAAPSNS
jgi:hypothetical protein